MNTLKKQIFLCTAGTMLEWYEFSLFACLAPILSQLFFPKSNHFAALMATFAIFASGYIMRPLGAFFFGHLGDTLGRKSTVLITIILMAIATTTIGLIPIGTSLSTIALVICRLAQGFATSGEYPGAIALLAEQDSQGYKGFVTSFSVGGTGAGIFIGTVICAALMKFLGDAKMLAWGWRIPFLLGAPLGIFGYILRRSMLESIEFNALKKLDGIKRAPILQLLRHHYKEFFAVLCLYIVGNIIIYMNLLYFGNYALTQHKLQAYHLMYLNLLVTFVYTVSLIFFGLVSDFVDRAKLLKLGYGLVIVSAYPIFYIILHGSIVSQFVAQGCLSLLLGMFVGPLALVAAETFPTAVRYTGLSLALNIAASVFGGSAPIVCTWLVEVTKTPFAPAFYIIFSALIALIALAAVITPSLTAKAKIEQCQQLNA